LAWAGNDVVAALLQQDRADECITLVIGFGQMLYDEDQPRYWFKNVLSQLGLLKRQWVLRAGWDAYRCWELEAPSESRVPIPPLIFLAIITLSLHWEWFDFALGLSIIFEAALRPGELLSLQGAASLDSKRVFSLFWDDIVFPEDSFGSEQSCVLIRIKRPKTRHAARAAARQVGRVRAVELIEWLRLERAVLGGDGDSRVIRLSYRQAVDRFRAVLAALQLEQLGLSLSSLRAGRATVEYERTESLDRCRALLRHVWVSSTDIYVQELQAALAGMQFDGSQKELIGSLAANGPRLLLRRIVSLRTSPPAVRGSVGAKLFG